MRFIITALFILFVSVSPVYAGNTHDAEKIVVEVSDDVLKSVRKERESYKDNPEDLHNRVLKYLDPVIDFKSFSKGVMGKYYKQATADEREKFAIDFKKTLVSLYTKALVAFEVKDMSVLEVKENSPKNVQVIMRVTSPEEAVYLVQYSMRKKGDQWYVRNVIMDGVNLGLTYRNQFYSAMNTHNGNLSEVVNEWTVAMNNSGKDTDKN